MSESRFPAVVPADEVAAAYESTRARMTELARPLTAEQASTTVQACPDWSIHDLISHNVGLATDLSQGRRGDGDQQQWLDDMVQSRRAMTLGDQLDEWAESGPAFAQHVRDHPRMGFLLIDIVAHEHDLAHAIGTASDRNSRALEIVMDTTAGHLMSGDLATAGLGAVELVDTEHDRTWRYGEGDPAVVLRGSMFELFRLTGSRRSRAQLAACDHDGDLHGHLDGLLHMPPPDDDLVE